MRIDLNGSCNNNCVFCQILKHRKTSDNLIKKRFGLFKQMKNDNRIIFTGAESTIRRDIFLLCRQAKKSGAEIVQLNTNGRMLADKKFVQKIIKSGANYFKISLHGYCAEQHDRITGRLGSFKETICGLENLIEFGQGENIVLSVVLCRLNYKNLPDILRLVKQWKIKKIQLNIAKTTNGNLLVPLEVLAHYISRARYEFFFDFLIKAKNLPYCLLPEPESLFLKSTKRTNYLYLPGCRDCKYNKICNGILKPYSSLSDLMKIKAVLNLPVEVMIEVEPRCNFGCNFCFNRVSFARNGHKGRGMTTDFVKKVIGSIKQAGIPIVRFTGGEPMLRSDILYLIKYAKSQGLQVRLNTNGSLIKSFSLAREMVKYLDYVLFQMHTYDAKKDEKITGFKGSLTKKIRAIKWFKAAGLRVIRISTIATRDNIINLEKFYELLKELKVDKWAINRLIPTTRKSILREEKKMYGLLVKKMVKIKQDKFVKRVPIQIHIVNAMPLCFSDPIKMNSICSGGRSVDGHERLVVDPRGFAKPIYYIEKNIGNPLDILACWNHHFMKTIRSYAKLPAECHQCPLLDKCKGGNRFCAYAANGSYWSADPLMNYNNIKNFIW